MSDFEQAIPIVLKHEGGFVIDHAGPTNMGVVLRDLVRLGLAADLDGDGDVDVDDLRAMTREDAIRLFYRPNWDYWRIGLIEPQWVATKLFDCCVNMGRYQGSLVIQRALNSVAGDRRLRVIEDGIVGPKTRAALAACASNYPHARDYQGAARSEMAAIYRLIVANIREHAQYLAGWLARAYGF